MVRLNPYAAVLKRAAILAQKKAQGLDHPSEKLIQVSFISPALFSHTLTLTCEFVAV